jgi:hypothetical protein
MTGIVEVVAREMRRDFRIPRSLEHAGYGEVYRACSCVSLDELLRADGSSRTHIAILIFSLKNEPCVHVPAS